MSLESGWDFEDHLQMLLYPETKWESLKIIFLTIIFFIPIILVLFLSFLISGLVGFFSAGKKTKCDRCGKMFLNDCGQLWKFYDFCSSCSNKQMKVEEKFIKELMEKRR